MADRLRTGDGAELWQEILQAPPGRARSLVVALPAGASPPLCWGHRASEVRALARVLPDIAAAQELLVRHTTRLLKHDHWPVEAIAWSPDGRHLASMGSRTIQLWDGSSGAGLRRLAPSQGRLNTMAWSPDGRLLAAEVETISTMDGVANRIWIWDADGGRCLRTLSDVAQPWTMRWLADGQQLAYVSTRRTIEVWSATAKGCPPLLTGHPWHDNHLAWSLNGRHLASAARDGTITLWDLASGARTHTLPGHGKRICALAWSPDGRQLACAGMNQSLQLWDPGTGACTRTLRGHGARVTDLAWTPEGRALATASTDRTIRFWDRASGASLQILAGHQDSVHKIAFSADGRCLASASADRTIRLWDAGKGVCIHRLTLQSPALASIAWSPDGRTLAVIGGDGWIQLWRRDLHELAALFETPLASWDRHHWDLVAACQRTWPPQDTVVLPWLRFISALGGVVRRFDVAVAEASGAPDASSFAVLLDG